jgi:Flp pilus assembly protein TadG
MMIERFRQFRPLHVSSDGAVLVEFAFVAPMLATLMLGMVDMGLWNTARLSVDRAARAGAEYAVASGYNSTAISAAITSNAPARSGMLSAITATPAPTRWYGCVVSNSSVVATVQGAVCADGTTAGTYVTSNASATYSYAVPWPGLGSSVTISSRVKVRIS